MTYQAWTAKHVELRILEAARTLMLCPNVQGPKQYGNAMPEPVRRQVEAYGSNAPRYRKAPEPGAIDRMEKTWGWINARPEDDRRLVYTWSYFKVRRGVKVKQIIASMGYSSRTFYRELARVFADICEDLNKNHVPDLTLAQTSRKIRANQISSPKYENRTGNAWMADGARPQVPVEAPKSRVIRPRKRRKRQQRQNPEADAG